MFKTKEKKYKTVNDFFKYQNMNNSKIYKESYNYTPEFDKKIDIKIDLNRNYSAKNNDINHIKETDNKNEEHPYLELKWESVYADMKSPKVWGPSQWFTYHNAANNYPDEPSPITKEKMKNIIIGIPVLLPCVTCKEHATAYIESRLSELDNIVSNKENLFNFFVDFHNQVNKRYNKKIYTYDEAKKLYSKTVKINTLTYS